MSTASDVLTLQALKKPGFFGLNALHEFFGNEVDSAFRLRNDVQFELDFSNVTYWDISALLWMVIALHHFIDTNSREGKNIHFKLRFPHPARYETKISSMSDRDIDYLRSADYLRRWKFVKALKNLADDPNELLVDEQVGYLDGEPEYYFPTEVAGPIGLLEELLSVRLVEIRNLTDLNVPREQRHVQGSLVNSSLKEFSTAIVSPILQNQCGISEKIASKFCTHLLYEAVANVLQHPNATIGMFSISRLGPNKLILAVADNGLSICHTIYEHYRQVHATFQIPPEYEGLNSPSTLRGELIAHATLEGTSRKLLTSEGRWEELEIDGRREASGKIGYGLTYIRNATTGDFKGDLVIAVDGVCVRFTGATTIADYKPGIQAKSFQWSGNLLRIQIPARDTSRYRN